MAYADAFEPSAAEKQLANATGEFVTGAPAMGTADQNAAIDAANKTAGVWDGDDPQDGTDSNDDIEDANMLPGIFVGEVSSDAVNGADVGPLPPNQTLLSNGQTIIVSDGDHLAANWEPGTAHVDTALANGKINIWLAATTTLIKSTAQAIPVVSAAEAPVAGSPGTPIVTDGAMVHVKLTV